VSGMYPTVSPLLPAPLFPANRYVVDCCVVDGHVTDGRASDYSQAGCRLAAVGYSPIWDTVCCMSSATPPLRTPSVLATDPGHGDPFVFVGLDCETSAVDLASGARLIQAGVAVWSAAPGGEVDIFCSLLRQDVMEWSDEAAAVHQIPREALTDAPLPSDVDSLLYDWMCRRGAVAGRQIVIPVGLNVGSFDLPFFQQALPRFSSLLSHRTVDLNSLCFTFAGWDPCPSGVFPRGFESWKSAMKDEANSHLAQSGFVVREHDAGFDAAQALLGWWWLRQQLFEAKSGHLTG
jgi:hypothetical protein